MFVCSLFKKKLEAVPSSLRGRVVFCASLGGRFCVHVLDCCKGSSSGVSLCPRAPAGTLGAVGSRAAHLQLVTLVQQRFALLFHG